jgi:hypothetical protein
MEKEIYFGRAYQINLVSERKKSFFFLDILATIVDGCEAIKMKKSQIVIGFLQIKLIWSVREKNPFFLKIYSQPSLMAAKPSK